MWPDNETDTDLLGFEVHANLLRAVVTDALMLPVSIGVFGDWGGGKTSIMKMLEKSLDPERYAVGSPQRAECETSRLPTSTHGNLQGTTTRKLR